MDYSQSIHDADNPAAASPWGSSPVSSPRHARTSSFPTSGDGPPSPTPFGSRSGIGSYSQDDTMGGGSFQRPESSAGTESVTESDGRRPDTAESVQSQPEQPPLPTPQSSQQQGIAQQQHSGQTNKPEPARYHHTARQPQPPHGPQYKLQAKITGLERTGRKDPIMRFDVHVCIGLLYVKRKLVLTF